MATRRTGRSAVLGALLLAGSAGALLAAWRAASKRRCRNPSVPEPAKPVDLDRYLGRWFELARYENRFERGCEGVTAEYRRRPDGLIDVVNTCREGSPAGPRRVARGRAKVVPGSGNAKLKVSFFGPFFLGDYWILDRAEDYAWSIVGEPRGRFLWLLARDPAPGEDALAMLLGRAHALGCDVRRLRPTRQPPARAV